jgi:hypothetical protein
LRYLWSLDLHHHVSCPTRNDILPIFNHQRITIE